MSVLASKRGTPAVNIKPAAHDLYKKLAQLVLDTEIVPKQLASEFKYPILQTARDMISHLAVACSCDTISDHDRRSRHFMDANDMTVVLDEQLELLSECRNLPKETTLEILKDNCYIARGIRSIMCDDRKVIDAHFKSQPDKKREELSAIKTAELIKGVSRETTKGKTIDGPSDLVLETRSNDFSMKELRKRALEESPEFVGIINNPTDPESPVLDHVRDVQTMRSKASEMNIRKNRTRKSSH